MTKGKTVVKIVVSAILTLVMIAGVGFGVYGICTWLFESPKGLSDKEIKQAITKTVDTVEQLGENVNTLRLATEVSSDDIEAETLMVTVPIAYIGFVDYLIEKNVLKINTLQYDELAGPDSECLYVYVTQNNGLVYVNVLYEGPTGGNITYTSYEINYDFKNDRVVDFNFVQFTNDTDDNNYYVSYRYDFNNGIVYMANPKLVKTLSSKQYQLDVVAGKVNAGYINSNFTSIRFFKGNLNDLTDCEGYDVNVEPYNSEETISFEALSAGQQSLLLEIYGLIKNNIIEYQPVVDSINKAEAEHCDTISEANDYINEKYL